MQLEYQRILIVLIHRGRVANALGCNTRVGAQLCRLSPVDAHTVALKPVVAK